ncbi:MAG: class I SAM-dependent methyltransferase [Amphritea sp.]
MTRLDSVIRRLQAQRACLDWAAGQVADQPGVVFELGLGNGRTFDHLRTRLARHEIFVFDRQIAAHPDCIPDQRHLYLGNIQETLPLAVGEHPSGCVLVHCDIGTGVAAEDSVITAFISQALIPALAPGALIISDQRLELEGSEAVTLPPSVTENRYFIRLFQGQ